MTETTGHSLSVASINMTKCVIHRETIVTAVFTNRPKLTIGDKPHFRQLTPILDVDANHSLDKNYCREPGTTVKLRLLVKFKLLIKSANN